MALDFLGDTSQFFNNYNTGDLANNTFAGVNYDYSLPTSTDVSSLYGQSLLGGGNGLNVGRLPWGNIIKTLGQLGSGVGGFISAREAGKMQNYIPTTQWLGNGLARTGYINNSAIKQNELDKATGATNALGQAFSLLGNRFNTEDLNQDNSDFGKWLQQKTKEYGNSNGLNYNGWGV